MRKITIIITILGILPILISCFQSNDNEYKDNSRGKVEFEKKKIENDKIIIIEGAKYLDIKKALKQFCNIYNKENYVAVIRISKISEKVTVLTFPYDIDFTHFCFLTNYLYYPNEIFYKADIKAWTTTKSTDEFITENSADKYVLLYVPSNDAEHDNVYMTTEDNKCFKLGFSIGDQKELKQPVKDFVENKYEIEDAENKRGEEIK